MKKIKKILPVLLAVVLLMAALPAQVLAASEGTAGQTVTVPISFSGVYGLQGTVSIDNTDDFTLNSVSVSAGNASSSTNGARFSSFSTDANAMSGSIQVSITIKSSAQPGDKCTVSVSDGISTTADYQDKAWSGSNTLVVKASDSSDDDQSPSGPQSPSNPQKPNNPQKPDSPSKPTSPTTSVDDKVDYTELKEQIAIADGLTKDGYTKASWDALMTAVAEAKDALDSKDQDVVDKTAQALKDAITGLAKMDYSNLQAALDSANKLIETDELGSLWADLSTAIANYTELLTSDDQAAVDAAAADIMGIMEQISALLGEDVETGAAEPEGEYCNIPIHKVWPILFFISLAVNVVLIILLMSKKKEKKGDDTPVVNYRIGDDD